MSDLRSQQLGFLRRLNEEGLRIEVQWHDERERNVLSWTHYGMSNLHRELSPEEVLHFLDDREGFVAKRMGVSVDLYRRFIDAGGYPRCGAITLKGKRCRMGVVTDEDVWTDSFERFDKLDGGYCRIHDPR